MVCTICIVCCQHLWCTANPACVGLNWGTLLTPSLAVPCLSLYYPHPRWPRLCPLPGDWWSQTRCLPPKSVSLCQRWWSWPRAGLCKDDDDTGRRCTDVPAFCSHSYCHASVTVTKKPSAPGCPRDRVCVTELYSHSDHWRADGLAKTTVISLSRQPI